MKGEALEFDPFEQRVQMKKWESRIDWRIKALPQFSPKVKMKQKAKSFRHHSQQVAKQYCG